MCYFFTRCPLSSFLRKNQNNPVLKKKRPCFKLNPVMQKLIKPLIQKNNSMIILVALDGLGGLPLPSPMQED